MTLPKFVTDNLVSLDKLKELRQNTFSIEDISYVTETGYKQEEYCLVSITATNDVHSVVCNSKKDLEHIKSLYLTIGYIEYDLSQERIKNESKRLSGF